MTRKHVIANTKWKRLIKEVDCFSELPDEILSSIISYFIVRDAVNASVLSSRWRHLCASLPKLDLHFDSMFPTHKDCCSMDISRQYKEIFVRAVNQILQDYQGTRLVFFRVSFCLEKDSTCDVDQWVSFAIRMGVEHLILKFSCIDCYIYDRLCYMGSSKYIKYPCRTLDTQIPTPDPCPTQIPDTLPKTWLIPQILHIFVGKFLFIAVSKYPDIWGSRESDSWTHTRTRHPYPSPCNIDDRRSRGRDLYTLRSALLVQGNVTKLQCLFLCSCILGPGVITQFSGLKSLKLSDVPLGEHEVEVIGSCCLSLEHLSLTGCTLSPMYCISGSLQRLKFLAVTNCWGVEVIKLSATNLTIFYYDGSLITFSFSEVPNLKRMYFRVPDGKGAQYAFSQLAKDLPLVMTILLFSATNWEKCLPEDITTFSKIKELEFFSPRQSEFDTLKIIAILKACPLLEKFYLGNETKTYDHISNLPEDILSFILSLMNMRDAVKTRVLSPRWRYLSASTYDLHFDLFTMFEINYDEVYLNINSKSLWAGRLKFVKAVDQFLQLYRGPKIYSIRICYCFGNESAFHIDRWISFAVKMQIEKIDLNFSSVPQGFELYNFPCHLLPRGKTSQLKHMCLESCTLRPSPGLTDCLNSLKTLDLNNVLLNQSDFESILFGCINLEGLRLKNCNLPAKFCIRGQPLNLKLLVLFDCRGAQTFVLSSIRLTTFDYIGRVRNLTFLGVPWIEKMHLRFMFEYERGSTYMFNGLAKDIPQLQILSLVLTTYKAPPIPENMTKFNHLKELELFVFFSTDFDFLSITYILNASPLLQKFHLAIPHICFCGIHWGSYFRGPRQEKMYCKHLHYQLKEIEISGFNDKGNSMKLAIYLLNSAVALERMIVDSQSRLYHGDGRWTYSQNPLMEELERKRVYDVPSKEKAKPSAELIIL